MTDEEKTVSGKDDGNKKYYETLLIHTSEFSKFHEDFDKLFSALEDAIKSDRKKLGFEETDDIKRVARDIVSSIVNVYYDGFFYDYENEKDIMEDDEDDYDDLDGGDYDFGDMYI